jgi:hypothetical protein
MRASLKLGSVCGRLLPALALGCGQAHLSSDFPLTLEDLQEIRGDSDLSPQERREALYEFGFSDEIINGLMRDVRLGNQFGGDLRSAFDKVTTDRMTEMTPDEIQVYGDEGAGVQQTDDRAQSITQFFGDFSLNSRSALEAYLDAPNAFVPASVDAMELREVFVDFDPSNLISKLPIE